MNICIQCENSFIPSEIYTYFCSSECYEENTGRKSTLYDLVCRECGGQFKSPSSNRSYCSKKCDRAWNKRIKVPKEINKTITCANENCGKEFIKTHSNTKYCSQECRDKMHQNTIEIVTHVIEDTIILQEIKKDNTPKEHTRLCCVCYNNFETSDPDSIFCSKNCKNNSKRSRTHYAIFNRDGFRCGYCGVSPLREENVVLTLDHVVRYVTSRDDRASNIITACKPCNIEKHTDIPYDVQEILEIIKERNFKYKIDPDTIVNASTKQRMYSAKKNNNKGS